MLTISMHFTIVRISYFSFLYSLFFHFLFIYFLFTCEHLQKQDWERQAFRELREWISCSQYRYTLLWCRRSISFLSFLHSSFLIFTFLYFFYLPVSVAGNKTESGKHFKNHRSEFHAHNINALYYGAYGIRTAHHLLNTRGCL